MVKMEGTKRVVYSFGEKYVLKTPKTSQIFCKDALKTYRRYIKNKKNFFASEYFYRFFEGIRENLREANVTSKKRTQTYGYSDIVPRTYFSIFGLLNVQVFRPDAPDYARNFIKEKLPDFSGTDEKILRQYAGLLFHTFENPDNFCCGENGQLQIRDCGAQGVGELLQDDPDSLRKYFSDALNSSSQ